MVSKTVLILNLHVFIYFSAESSFPYVKKRIMVVDTSIEEKGPIEVAFEEMQNRVMELNEIVNAKTCDAKKLQLK